MICKRKCFCKKKTSVVKKHKFFYKENMLLHVKQKTKIHSHLYIPQGFLFKFCIVCKKNKHKKIVIFDKL